jgi:preprotein translocase subunit SecG
MTWKLSPTFMPDERGKLAQLWVTSVAGTALVIVIQTFGEDSASWKFDFFNPDPSFMLDRMIRYLLALWFGIYMVLAYLANEARPVWTKTGLLFDVLQSVAVFIALGFLGFVTQDFKLFQGNLDWPLGGSFFTMFLIAGWTLASHSKAPKGEENEKAWKDFQLPLQWVRGYVLVASLIPFLFVVCLPPISGTDSSELVGYLIAVLLCLLGLYGYAIFAFQKGSYRHDTNKVNELNLETAVENMKNAGSALETAATALKSITVKQSK